MKNFRLIKFFSFSFLFADFNCSQISCATDCTNSTLSTLPNFHDINNEGHHQRSLSYHMNICCKLVCREHCTTDDGSVHPTGAEWKSYDDPCTTFFCDYGTIRPFVQLCRAIPCPSEYHYIPSGDCCPRCDPTWAEFCPEDEECEIVCQFGFRKDEERNCDLCRCAPRNSTSFVGTTITTTTTSTTQTIRIPSSSSPRSTDADDEFSPESYDDGVHVNKNKNIWPMYDVEMRQLFLIGFATVLLLACLVGIGLWCVHRRAYKPLPLLNSNSTGGSTA